VEGLLAEALGGIRRRICDWLNGQFHLPLNSDLALGIRSGLPTRWAPSRGAS